MLKNLIQRLRGQFPTSLPRGMTELESFVTDIFSTYGFADSPHYRHAIATMILHLDTLCDKKSKAYFARAVRKSQANEVAFEMLQQLKEQEEKKKAELKALEELPPTIETGEQMDGRDPN